MQDIFRGRSAELQILDKKFKQKGFVMTVLYGRRRGFGRVCSVTWQKQFGIKT